MAAIALFSTRRPLDQGPLLERGARVRRRFDRRHRLVRVLRQRQQRRQILGHRDVAADHAADAGEDLPADHEGVRESVAAKAGDGKNASAAHTQSCFSTEPHKVRLKICCVV